RRDPAARPPDASAFLRALQAVRTDLRIDQVPVPVPAAAWSMAAASTPTAVGAPPTDHGPRGTRALARVDGVTGGPDIRTGGPTGFPSEPPSGPQPWKGLPHDDPYLRERARNRRAFVVWMVIVLMLASAIGVGAWWLGSGRWTVVPNLTGLQRSAVEATLAAADLKSTLTEDHHDAVPGGAVVSSDPGPGYRAVRGSDVTVVISLGHPVVPDLVAGIAVQEAEDALREADLSPRRDQGAEEFHDTIPRGAVIGLRPAAGTTLTVGAPVTLVISKGVAPTTVPDVRGLRQADAVSALARAGLTAQVRRQFDDQVPGGRAIGTDPKVGTGTTRGTSVILLVSTAPVVPDVVGLSVTQAQQVLADAGLNSTVSQSLGDSQLFGFQLIGGQVISQSPQAGQPVRPGTTVALTVL
ncbi:MAG: PASTA domain-containing protein, partial [Pseudonocardiaceae bacterium]